VIENQRNRKSRVDFFDFDRRELLPMAGLAFAVFSSTELDYGQFFALGVVYDFRRD
jgi:hypothetical protein